MFEIEGRIVNKVFNINRNTNEVIWFERDGWRDLPTNVRHLNYTNVKYTQLNIIAKFLAALRSSIQEDNLIKASHIKCTII